MAEPNETPAEGTQLAEVDKNALAAIVKAEMDRYWSDPDSVIADMIAKAIEQQMALKESKDDDPEDPEDSMDEETPEDKDDDPKMAELSELRAQVAELREEKDRAEFAAAYPAGSTITLTPELLDTMYAVRNTAPEAFATLSEHAKPPATPAPVELSQRPPAIPAPMQINWGKRFGSSAGSPADNDAAPPMSLSERKQTIRDELKREFPNDAAKRLALYNERTANLS